MGDFKYYNANPRNIETDDCVVRAISLGLGIDYTAIENLLSYIGETNSCDCLNIQCYRKLLEDIFCLPVRYCYSNESVQEIAKQFSDNILIIRIEGHLTASYYGKVYDLWKCNDKTVYCYWITK